MKNNLLIATMSLLLTVTISRAPHAADNIAEPMRQITALTAEKTQLEEKFDETLSLVKANNKQYDDLQPERKRIDAEAKALGQDHAANYRPLCVGTYPEEQFAAVESLCSAWLNSYNSRLNANKAAAENYDREVDELKASNESLKAGFDQDWGHHNEVISQLAAAQKAIVAAQSDKCSQSRTSKEAGRHGACLQTCGTAPVLKVLRQ